MDQRARRRSETAVVGFVLELRCMKLPSLHPEIGTNEVFFTNASPRQFDAMEYRSKRIGTIAYDGKGNQLAHPNWFPVFLSRTEVEALGEPLQALRRNYRATAAQVS